jgi:hypothetical protein
VPRRDERSESRGDALESTRTADDGANGEEMAERVGFEPGAHHAAAQQNSKFSWLRARDLNPCGAARLRHHRATLIW